MVQMRTNVFYHGDCLFVMKHDIPDESIDLIYLDPPFFTGKVQESSKIGYLFKWSNSPLNSKKFIEFLKNEFGITLTEQVKFYRSDNNTVIDIFDNDIMIKLKLDKDTRKVFLSTNDGRNIELRALKSNSNFIITRKAKWDPGAMQISYDDSKKFWKEKGTYEQAPEWLKHIALQRPDFASYLYYMMERLQQCYRVLKSTGSIYLHCDWRASHYLKMIMDEVFGYKNFRNEIIWHYFMGTKSDRYWGRKHDTILFYTKSDRWTFNPQRWKRRLDFKPNLKNESTGSVTGKDEYGYYSIVKGDDVWDIKGVFNMSREYVNYPTQKPLALLKRIIKASSNENDVILDPFCGCGTTVIAAHELNRKWIGIDINENSFLTISKRCSQMKLDNPLKPIIIERTLDSVLGMIRGRSRSKGYVFEKWVNEFFNAKKPADKGVDGITPDGIPIQVKTFRINDTIVNGFYGQALLHHDVPKPLKTIRLVSGEGYTESARQAKFEIESKKGVKVELLTPEDLLK